MPQKIAIASGKGGTGKTTVSVNLFHFISKNWIKNTILVDCDVEEPNDLIFFNSASVKHEKEIVKLVPSIDPNKCTHCRKCVEYCEFNAITIIPSIKFVEVNNSLCHSCGACSVACSHGAITETPDPIGNVSLFDTGTGNGLAEGRLKIGSPMQTMLINELKNELPKNNDLYIFDAPPGTSCSAVETVSETDYVVLVTEPTPFGVHDLKLMVELLRDIQIPFGVVINKAGLGNDEIYNYLACEKIEILGKIPFCKDYAAQYATGNLLEEIPEEITLCYNTIVSKLKNHLL